MSFTRLKIALTKFSYILSIYLVYIYLVDISFVGDIAVIASGQNLLERTQTMPSVADTHRTLGKTA